MSPADPILDFCRRLPGATEDVKWGDDLVFSVGKKMFFAFFLPEKEKFSLKVDPMMFGALTQKEGIAPSRYLGRHSWITVESRSVLPLETVLELIESSHALVAEKLPKRVQRELGLLGDSS